MPRKGGIFLKENRESSNYFRDFGRVYSDSTKVVCLCNNEIDTRHIKTNKYGKKLCFCSTCSRAYITK